MSDITMCTGQDEEVICPMRDTCYRYLAPVTPQWQSYFVELPYRIYSDSCENYWQVEGNKKQ